MRYLTAGLAELLMVGRVHEKSNDNPQEEILRLVGRLWAERSAHESAGYLSTPTPRSNRHAVWGAPITHGPKATTCRRSCYWKSHEGLCRLATTAPRGPRPKAQAKPAICSYAFLSEVAFVPCGNTASTALAVYSVSRSATSTPSGSLASRCTSSCRMIEPQETAPGVPGTSLQGWGVRRISTRVCGYMNKTK